MSGTSCPGTLKGIIMYTQMTMHNVRSVVREDTRKVDLANMHIDDGLDYPAYKKELSKGVSPYVDNHLLMSEDQYYQLSYKGMEVC